jgi:hypothetical protein
MPESEADVVVRRALRMRVLLERHLSIAQEAHPSPKNRCPSRPNSLA